jgi:hypothetical protein
VTFLDRGFGVALALAAMAAMVWLSNAPITVHGSEQAVLRLAWSARPERIESCRQQSQEELTRLPAHMRQPVVCEGTTAEYRLTVLHGGKVVAEQPVRGGGLRQDRSLYVFHEVPLDPGDATIEVQFDRLGPDPAPATPGERSNETTEQASGDRRQPRGEAVPPHLSFQQRLRIRPREVILVTYSPERRALVAIQDAAAAAH